MRRVKDFQVSFQKPKSLWVKFHGYFKIKNPGVAEFTSDHG